MSERKARKSVLFFGIYEPPVLSLYDRLFTNRIKSLRFFCFSWITFHVCMYHMFMSVLRDAWLHSKAYYYAYFLCSVLGLVQYSDERRKVLVVDGTFSSTVKKEFEIDSAETLESLSVFLFSLSFWNRQCRVFQDDDEWDEYLDINELDVASLKDKGKLRVVLEENATI